MQVNFHFIEFSMTNNPLHAAVLLRDSGPRCYAGSEPENRAVQEPAILQLYDKVIPEVNSALSH